MYARIQNGTVIFVMGADPSTVFAPETAAEFVACPDDVQVGWLYDGDEFTEPMPPPPTIPSVVTMRQARLALLGAGLLDDIDAAINGLPSPQKEAARIEWEYSQEVQRRNGCVSVLAPMLGLTGAQLDTLFVVAEGL